MSSTAQQLGKLAGAAVVAGLVGVVALGIGFMTSPEQAARSYLVGWILWWEATIGCLALALVYQLVGGYWGGSARPYFDAGARNIVLMLLLAIPLALALPDIYKWTDESYRTSHELGENRLWYLQEGFFLARGAVYFAVWIVCAFIVTARPFTAEGKLKRPPDQNLGMFSALALVASMLAVTWATFDWLMSLDPMFKSSMYGVIAITGGAACATAACALGVCLTKGQPSLPAEARPQTLNDLANLMLAALLLWCYVSFGQFLIVWSGNIPEEAEWYLARQDGGWSAIATLLMIGHFAVPFALLLSRDVKRNPKLLAAVAMWILIVHAAEIIWLVVPTWHPGSLHVHWLDIISPLAIGGLWLGSLFFLARGRLDPFLREEAAHERT